MTLERYVGEPSLFGTKWELQMSRKEEKSKRLWMMAWLTFVP